VAVTVTTTNSYAWALTAGQTVYTATIYVDGIKVVSSGGTAPLYGGFYPTAPALAVPWYLGVSGYTRTSPYLANQYFWMSHISVWVSTALTPTQVANHYNTLLNSGQSAYETALLADSPTSAWYLTETTGSTFHTYAPNPFPVWAATTYYPENSVIYDSVSGSIQVSITPATSGGSYPSFSSTLGIQTDDGSVVWVSQGGASNNMTPLGSNYIQNTVKTIT
jgi:hypothetical protein